MALELNRKLINVTYQLTNEILNALNNNLLMGGIFCNIENAFDYVNHIIL